MTRSSNHRWPAQALAISIVIALGGCTNTEEPSDMNPSEAKAEVDALLSPVQELVAGDWEDMDGAAEACAGGSGARFGLYRSGPGVPVESQQAILDQVAELWAEAGFEPSIIERSPADGLPVTEVRFPGSGFGPDGLFVSLWLSHNATTLEGQSRCVTGDANETNRGLSAQ